MRMIKTPEAATEAIELTDLLLEDMKLDLNTEKTALVQFEKGFRFLGVMFLNEGIDLPMLKEAKPDYTPALPPALTLKRYFELRAIDSFGN